MNITQANLIYKFSKPLNSVILKTLKNTGIILMIATTASNSLLAQSTRAIPRLDIDQTSYYQKSSAPEFGELDLFTLPVPVQAQVWSETFAIGVYPMLKSCKVRLGVDKKFGETVTVRLLDSAGKVLYEKWLGKLTNKFSCYFNFSRSEDGSFTIEVANGKEVIRKTISLATPDRTLTAMK